MSIQLSQYSYGESRRRGEGLRIGCTRYLVRGVKKKDYAKRDIFDVWLPTLAPSTKLLRRYPLFETAGKWERFALSYRNEMKKTNPRQVIRMLARLSKATPISVGCYCNGPRCHRFILEKLIKSASAGRF